VRLARLVAFALLLAFPVGTTTLACGRKSTPVAEVDAAPPVVNDTTAGLMLTWVDDKGGFHNELRVLDVPASARELVRVRVLDPAPTPEATLFEGAQERVFVADLRTAGAHGAYPVRVISRSEFEDVAVARRAKHGVVLTPQAAASAGAGAPAGSGSAGSAGGAAGGAGDVAAAPAVIIYGASWCGPCHQAAAYLKQRGVAFVEHDIEQDSSAAREMQKKLAKAGVRGGSIPVLDVRGRILVGFDARAVDRALGQAL
jgi:glutaredoxin